MIDTSVLINFLVIGRLDLLGCHQGYRFVVTDHVGEEITEHYSEQVAQLQNAKDAGWITEISLTDAQEVEMFARLTESGRLGNGECSAIAVAACRHLPLAMDDKAARRSASSLNLKITLLDTASLMVSFIQAGLITIGEADEIKHEWEQDFRFRLRFGSFAERI